MPPVLLLDTNGVIMDDFLLCVQAFVTKTSASFPLGQVRGLLFTLLPLADAAKADAVHLIAFGVFHLPQMPCKRPPHPARQACPLFPCSSLERA